MAENAKSGFDYSTALLAIQALRSNPDYLSAETLRRARQAKLHKAKGPKRKTCKEETDPKTAGLASHAMIQNPGSKDYAAIVLLINTWNTIGRSVRLALGPASANAGSTGDPWLDAYLNALFETIPVCNMYLGLKAAMKELTDEWGEDFAPDFEWLQQEYLKWLDRTGKDAEYRSRHCCGIRARFG